MTVYVDASALVALHTETPQARVVRATLDTDDQWASSALTMLEALALVDRVADGPNRADLEDLVRLTWDRVAVVPVDAALTFWADSSRCRWVPRRALASEALPIRLTIAAEIRNLRMESTPKSPDDNTGTRQKFHAENGARCYGGVYWNL